LPATMLNRTARMQLTADTLPHTPQKELTG
jgi:hypothetical protein